MTSRHALRPPIACFVATCLGSAACGSLAQPLPSELAANPTGPADSNQPNDDLAQQGNALLGDDVKVVLDISENTFGGARPQDQQLNVEARIGRPIQVRLTEAVGSLAQWSVVAQGLSHEVAQAEVGSTAERTLTYTWATTDVAAGTYDIVVTFYTTIAGQAASAHFTAHVDLTASSS